MHLLHTTRLELQEFIGSDIPKYAILSHTWGDQEVLFRHVWNTKFPSDDSLGSNKIRNACAQAVKDGWDYIWIDTCCINKESSAELSEAINSMYQWYKASEVCYAFLADVSPRAKMFKESRWFTRGWTLQELLAPRLVEFYDQDWHYVASKGLRSKDVSFLAGLAKVTGIPMRFLNKERTPSIAQKMSWVARRQTKRGEDIAYCMLGLFDVNMPLLYGEGETKAFFRLQKKILKISQDDSIFAWNNPSLWCSGLLAQSPYDFVDCGSIERGLNSLAPGGRRRPPGMTSLGVDMELPVTDLCGDLCRLWESYSVLLACYKSGHDCPGRLLLHIQFFADPEMWTETRNHSRFVDMRNLIQARKLNIRSVQTEHPIFELLNHAGPKRQVIFRQTRSISRSDSWHDMELGATSWFKEASVPEHVAPPDVNFKVGGDIFRSYSRGNRSYQSLRNNGELPQLIDILKGTDITSSPTAQERPCGLLLRQIHHEDQHILLRWCFDGDETPSVEILYLVANVHDSDVSHGGFRKPSSFFQVWGAGMSLPRGDLGSVEILSRALSRQGARTAVEVDQRTGTFIWISLLDHQDHGDDAVWTIEIDKASDNYPSSDV